MQGGWEEGESEQNFTSDLGIRLFSKAGQLCGLREEHSSHRNVPAELTAPE